MATLTRWKRCSRPAVPRTASWSPTASSAWTATSRRSPQLLALCERHDAWLVVDDAHGFGVLGAQGRGALEHFNLRSPQLVYMGTLGKAAGVSGAFVAAHDTVIEWLVQRARPYIYTTASPPALAHALSASLALIAARRAPGAAPI